MQKYNCGFCEYFKKLKLVRQFKDGDDVKRCDIGKCKVTVNSFEDCQYFAPKGSFYCENNNCFLDLIQCINRRHNKKNLAAWKNCEGCRQWDKALRDIVLDFILDQKQVKKPPKNKKRSLNRRTGNARATKSGRKLTRRTDKPKRKLTRRKSP